MEADEELPRGRAASGAASDGLVARCSSLLEVHARALVGIVGPPGSGKSTLATSIAGTFGEAAVVVPMDGFHLAQSVLERLGRAARKGAVDTFDAAGFVHLVRRLRERERVIYAPEFRREIEEPIAGAIAVEPRHRLVLVEGNYLLVRDGEWAGLEGLLDETWYLEPDDELRIERLVARHEAYGRSPGEARAWALGPDAANAALIASTRSRADLVIS